MERQNRFGLFGLIALALMLSMGIVVLNPGMSSQVAFAQGPKPKAPTGTLGSAFTYQGQLKQNGIPVNGSCYLQFNLYSDAGGKSLVAGPVNGNPNPVNVTNGYFTVQIDFGTGAFQGDARWLQPLVKCGSETAYTPFGLDPVTPTPYALFSVKTAWGQSMAGTGVGLTARSSNQIGLAGVATTSPIINPFTQGVFGVYGEGDDAGVWGQSSNRGVEGSNLSSNNYGQLGTSSYGVYGASPAGIGVEGINTNTSNLGDIGTSSAGVHGFGLGTGSVGVIGASFSGGNGVSGTAFNGGNGVVGTAAPGGYGVFSQGDMRVTGNLEVDGQATGFFPHPAYDSGWFAISQNTNVTLYHNLGGNTDNYVVDMQFRDDVFGTGVNQNKYGGTDGDYGACWLKLTSQSIVVRRGSNDQGANHIRIRIWVYR